MPINDLYLLFSGQKPEKKRHKPGLCVWLAELPPHGCRGRCCWEGKRAAGASLSQAAHLECPHLPRPPGSNTTATEKMVQLEHQQPLHKAGWQQCKSCREGRVLGSQLQYFPLFTDGTHFPLGQCLTSLSCSANTSQSIFLGVWEILWPNYIVI